MLHDGKTQLVVHSKKQGLKIAWNHDFMENDHELASELTSLVYRDNELTESIGALPDGLYGAMQLWTKFEEIEKNAD